MMKKIFSIFVSIMIVLSVTGCSEKHKALDSQAFLGIMEDMNYKEVKTLLTEDLISDTSTVSESQEYRVTCLVFKTAEKAKGIYDTSAEAAKGLQAKGDSNFSCTESGSGNSGKLVMNGKTVNGTKYETIVRVDNVLIRAVAKENSDADIKEIDKVMKTLGY